MNLIKTKILIVFVVFALFSCNEGKKKTPEVKNPITISPNRPTVNVYIENSASMDGYVKGITEFEQSIYSYLSDIKISKITDSLNLFYINSQIIPHGSDLADFIEKLEPTTFKARGGNRGTTDISNVFKTILAETPGNSVSILITDGIFSPGKGKDAQQYLVNQQIGIKTSMAEYLEKYPQTAVVVYQLTSSFKGKYFNREDKPTEIDDQRPYYIWLIGDVANIALLKGFVPDLKFKGGGIKHSYSLLPSVNMNIDYAILNTPKIGSFERDKKSTKTSIYNIKAESNGDNKGRFMFSIGMDLSMFVALLGDEYLSNTDSYARLINKQTSRDFFIEIEHNTNPNTRYTHNMKLTTDKIPIGDLDIILRNQFPQWINDINDDEGLDIYKDNAINRTFGFKYLTEGIYEAYNFSGSSIYTTMSFTLKN